QPDIAALAQWVERNTREDGSVASTLPPLLARSQPETPLPLSYAQERLWFLTQLDPESTGYNDPIVAKVTGKLQIRALECSFNEIVRRHASLRTTFTIDGVQPVQVIASELILSLPVVDLQLLTAREQQAAVQELALTEARHIFSLAQGP